MNFEDSPEEAAYRAKVRSWIAASKPDLQELPVDQRLVWTDGHKNAMRQWQATKSDAGYACITWSKESGGAGGTQIEDVIFSQEETAAGIHDPYYITGLKMLIPAIRKFNDDPKSLARVPPAVRGEEIWCQLFSEPASGSDSAGLRTMAVRDGDEWAINGQKVWNSGAAHADYGLLITRTDPDKPKHKGLTAFWLKMDTPGLEVRPIKTMGGDSELNEVFFDDVRIPDDQRVGEVDDGWSVVITTLMNERAAIGQSAGLTWSDMMDLGASVPTDDGTVMDDPAFRDFIADLYVDAEARRLIGFRILTAISRGEPPGPEGSAGKLIWSGLTQGLGSEAVDLLGHYGIVQDSELSPRGGAFQQRFLWSAGLRIGGGTDEIQKNVIAERVLGLPGDVRVDKGVPFREIPSGR
ncbi:MAG: acyl-CoA dehydrogenase family protein [Sphingomonadaceae bacterium]|nr:acyl-CoA dehydrogenase family protein [Sphingomonadaceae bacterium]